MRVFQPFIIFAVLFGVCAGTIANDKKETICHIPPGNPDNERTISVSQNAVKAHLRHGDRRGACDAQTSQLTITAVEEEIGLPPAPAGTVILVDGVEVGEVDDNGMLTINIAPGQHDIVALLPNELAARTSVTIEAGSDNNVQLILKSESLALVEDYQLALNEAENGVLPDNLDTLTLQITSPDGMPLPLTRVSGITVTQIRPGSSLDETGGGVPLTTPIRLDQFFTIADDGLSIIATDIDSIRSIFSGFNGQLELSVLAANSEQGVSYEDQFAFNFGTLRLEGTLLAPPSMPNLDVSNVEVLVTILGANAQLSTLSGSDGRFIFPSVPAGSIDIQASIENNDNIFFGLGTIFLLQDTSADLTVLGVEDVINGIPPLSNITSTGFSQNSFAQSSTTASERQAMARRNTESRSSLSANQATTTTETAMVTVSGGGQGASITKFGHVGSPSHGN